MKPSRINRILNILTVCRSDRNLQTDEITKLLNISKRTFFRDIEQLREVGINCNYNSRKRSYEVDRDCMLPEINLTLKEAQALLMLIKEADNYINLPFKKSALLASLKIERSLQTVIKKQCNFNLRNYSIRPHPQAKVKLLDDLISKLQTAIKRKKVVRLKISDLTKKAIDISIHPYHLFYSKHSWYVIGKTGSGNISTFRINKRMEVVITDKFFSEGDSFDLKEHMGRAWSIRPEGLIYSVELWFAPEVAADVISVNWHETQYSEIQGDGSAIVEFRVDGLNEIVWWVLGYGHHVKVLSPRPLRRKVKEIAEKILKTK